VLTVLATAGAALLGWLIVGPLLGVDLNVRIGSGTAQRVGPTTVVIAGLVAALGGWLLLAELERLTSRPRSA